MTFIATLLCKQLFHFNFAPIKIFSNQCQIEFMNSCTSIILTNTPKEKQNNRSRETAKFQPYDASFTRTQCNSIAIQFIPQSDFFLCCTTFPFILQRIQMQKGPYRYQMVFFSVQVTFYRVKNDMSGNKQKNEYMEDKRRHKI